MATLKFSERIIRFGIAMGAAYLWFVWGHSVGNYGRLEMTDRSFFGIHRAYRNDNGLNILMHGTTVHGAQFRDAERSNSTRIVLSLKGSLCGHLSS